MNDEAWAGPLTRTAVSGLFSASVSLPSTPGALTVIESPSLTL